MVKHAAALIAAGGLALACDAGNANPGESLPRPGSELPVAWATSLDTSIESDTAVLYWVLRTEDCFECQHVDYTLREVHYRHRDLVRVAVLHIGSPKEEHVVRRFLLERRLDVPIATIEPSEYLRMGSKPEWELPMLVLARGGRVAWSAAEGVGATPDLSLKRALQVRE